MDKLSYVITPDVLEDFSKKWARTEIPSWINIDVPSNIIKPESLSIIATDMSLISLRLQPLS